MTRTFSRIHLVGRQRSPSPAAERPPTRTLSRIHLVQPLRAPPTPFWQLIAPAQARPKCRECNGSGVDGWHVCNCVYRRIFRSCFGRFLFALANVDRLCSSMRPVYASCDRRNEEYAADFEIVARRALSPMDRRIFQMHFVEGLTSTACLRQIPIAQGYFYSRVYRIEEVLGKRYAELAPYPLFPVAAYFAPERRQATPLEIATMNAKTEIEPMGWVCAA